MFNEDQQHPFKTTSPPPSTSIIHSINNLQHAATQQQQQQNIHIRTRSSPVKLISDLDNRLVVKPEAGKPGNVGSAAATGNGGAKGGGGSNFAEIHRADEDLSVRQDLLISRNMRGSAGVAAVTTTPSSGEMGVGAVGAVGAGVGTPQAVAAVMKSGNNGSFRRHKVRKSGIICCTR